MEYYTRLWNLFRPSENARLFISEFEGKPVSAQLVIAIGDTVIAKRIGWSGEHARLQPNIALDWATIRWAKANGFRRYDLEGIDRDAAEMCLAGAKLPSSVADSPTGYKLRLGGDVLLLPETYCLWKHPLLGRAWELAGPRLVERKGFQKTVNRIRAVYRRG